MPDPLSNRAEAIAGFGSWRWDARTDRVEWSAQLFRIFGIVPDGFDGTYAGYLAHVHPEDRARVGETVQRAFEERGGFTLEERIVRPDGTVRWLVTRGDTIMDDDGAPVGMIGVCLDVTERRAVEEQMRALIELSPEGIIVHVGGRILYANPAARTLFDAGPPDAPIGRSVLDFIAPEARDEVARELATAEQAGAVRRGLERRVPLRDGRVLDLEISAAPVVYAGEPARQLLVRDVTVRKEAERALEREKATLEALIENAPEAIVLTDVQGTVRRVNDEFTRLFGYAPDEAIGCAVDDLLAPDDRRFEAEALTRRTVQVRGSLETVRQCKDGRLLDVSVLGAPIRLAEGTVGIFGIYRDITERRLTERTLNTLLRVAKVLNSTLDLDRLLDALAREAVALTGAGGGCAGLRTETGLETRRYLREGRWTDLRGAWGPGRGLAGWLLQHRRPYITNDARSDRQIAPALRETLAVRSALSVPVLDSTGEVIAFFEVHNARDASGFVDRDVRAVAALADQASIAIQNSLAYRRLEVARDALRRETAFAGMLQEVAVAANEAQDANAAIRRCLEIVSRIGRWDLAHAFRVREGDGTLEPTGIWTDEDVRWAPFRDATREMVLGPGAGVPGRVLTGRRAGWMEDLDDAGAFIRGAALRRCGLRSALAVPVPVGEDIVAILEFYATQPRAPDADLLHVAGPLGAILGRVFERERGHLELQEARDRFASFFHSSPVATGIGNIAEGRFREVNKRFLELLGLPRDRVIGHTALDLGVWPKPEDRQEMVRRLTQGGRLDDYEI